MIDFRDPVPQAHELVENGLITDDDFRAFTFETAVCLWGTQNPSFFEGAWSRKEAGAVLNATQPMRAAAE